MTDARRRDASFLRDVRAMHEWPLVLFTTLAIPAAGVFAARLVARSFQLLPDGTDVALEAAVLALVAGLVASTAHLGQPRRAPLALGRLGRNALCAEVALAATLVALGLVALLPGPATAARSVALDAAGIAALALLATLGLVYFLRARRPWRGPLVAQPMTSGLAAGTIVVACSAGAGTVSSLGLVLLAIDFALSVVSWRAYQRDDRFVPVHPGIFEHRGLLMALRVALVDLVPAALVAAHLPLVAIVPLGVGIVIDRFAFYGVAAMRTTEGEVAHVERLIARG
jgi:DMSO reductase anchor subunit